MTHSPGKVRQSDAKASSVLSCLHKNSIPHFFFTHVSGRLEDVVVLIVEQTFVAAFASHFRMTMNRKIINVYRSAKTGKDSQKKNARNANMFGPPTYRNPMR